MNEIYKEIDEEKQQRVLNEVINSIRNGHLTGIRSNYIITLPDLYKVDHRQLAIEEFQYIADQIEKGCFSGEYPTEWTFYCS